MKTVTIYTTRSCPYCIKAKQLLNLKGVSYEELRTDESAELAAEAVKKSGGIRTVPQIFIDDHHVGGCDELCALDREGTLDHLLKAQYASIAIEGPAPHFLSLIRKI